jgi:hypothetical protein
MPPRQAPQMPPRQMQGAPQSGPPPIVPPVVGGVAAQNPNLALFGQMAQMPQQEMPQQPGGQPRLTAAEMARLGRYGDQVIAHLTPGEIQVPPELQSPKVLATLHKEFEKVGVSPQQFMAGSPQSSINPASGAPEYSLWSAILPVAGAVVGSLIPGIGTAAGMALGGAVGGGLGGAIDGTGWQGALLGAAGGAAGGYLGGSGGISGLLGSMGSSTAEAAGSALASQAASQAAGAGAGAAFGTPAAAAGAAGAGAAGSAANAGWDQALQYAAGSAANAPVNSAASVAPAMSLGQKLMGGMYAGVGSSLGQGLAPPTTKNPSTPDAIGPPLPAINPNYGQLLGSGQASRPSFTNYSPYRAVAGSQPGYRFFPVAGMS